MKSKMIRYLDRTGLAILLITAVLGFLWIAANAVSLQRHLRQEKDLMARELTGLKQAKATLHDIGTTRSRMQDYAAGIYRRVPPRVEMGSLIKSLHALMKERRLTLAALQPQPPVSEELYTKIPIRLMFQGGFEQIYLFFRDLEAMEQLLIPEEITIAGSDSPQGGCRVEMSLLAFERKTTGSER